MFFTTLPFQFFSESLSLGCANSGSTILEALLSDEWIHSRLVTPCKRWELIRDHTEYGISGINHRSNGAINSKFTNGLSSLFTENI